ncbi:hypothetical protein TNCV_2228031 [Trichonephila clavipes]|nr:hypothetical protein TNCV_2228031 [Trichonephila clavipes]
MAACLRSRNSRALLPCQKNVLHTMILSPDPYKVLVRKDGHRASPNSTSFNSVSSNYITRFQSSDDQCPFPDIIASECWYFRQK